MYSPYLIFLRLAFLAAGLLQSIALHARQAPPAFPLAEVIRQLDQARKSNPDSARIYADWVEAALPSAALSLQIDGAMALGRLAYTEGRYEAALGYFETAERLSRESGASQWLSNALVRQGNALTMMGRTSEAITLLQKALTLAEQGGEQDDWVFALQSLAYAYQKGRDPARSVPHLETVLAHYQKEGHLRGQVTTLNLLHIAWSELDSLDRALSLLKAIMQPPLNEALTASDSGMVFNNLGRLYNMMGQYGQAAEALEMALAAKKRVGSPESLGKTLVERMTSLRYSGQYSDCLAAAAEASQLDSARWSVYTRRDYLMHLSACLAGAGEWAAAYQARLGYEALYDSTFNTENRESIREAELKLAEADRDRLLKAQQLAHKERDIAILFVALLALAGGGAFLLWRSQKRREAEVLAVRAASLEAQSRMRNDLFANISHELRTPLSLILGPLEMMENSKAPPSLAVLSGLRKNAKQLEAMVNQILNFARLEAGELPVNRAPQQVGALLSRTLSAFQSAAEIKSIALEFKNSLPDGLYLNLDAEKIEQILNNLLSNALKFTPAHGTVVLYAKQQGGFLQLQVQDTGPGISSQDIGRVFDRFFQGEEGARLGGSGSGVGLAFSSELAKLLNGQLTVDSKPGEGAAFTLRLPFEAVRPGLKQKAGAVAAAPLPSNNFQGRILLAEDNPEMQAFIGEVLGPGYAVATVANGQEALDLLMQDAAFDLVLSDVMMPVMDGFALLSAIKEREEWLGLPVVMLTARAAEEDRMRALSIGVDDYLVKPFRPRELQARVENLLTYRNWRKGQGQAARPEMPSGISAADWAWLREIEQVLSAEVSNTRFGVADLARSVNLSERQLHRRMKTVAGMTPNRYFREVRLNRALRLLESGQCRTVAEASFAVGFETPDYFSRIFEERFGRRPSSYTGGR